MFVLDAGRDVPDEPLQSHFKNTIFVKVSQLSRAYLLNALAFHKAQPKPSQNG